MDDNRKKYTYIIIFIACLLAAAAITYWKKPKTRGIESLKSGVMVLVKCMKCSAEYQMEQKEYFTVYQEEAAKIMGVPAMPCKECGEKGVYKAIKCESCGAVFFEGAVSNDFADRCTECGYSKTEERRARKKGGKNK